MSESGNQMVITRGAQFVPLYEIHTTANASATFSYQVTDQGIQQR